MTSATFSTQDQRGIAGRRAGERYGVRKGFTLVEVLVATFVMGIGMMSAVACFQIGMRNLDTARSTTLVTQVLQDEAERLRLENWAAISALPESQEILNPPPSHLANTLFAAMTAAGRIVVTRSVANVAGFSNMKQVTLRAAWSDLGGEHERLLYLRFAENGVNDYYYGASS